MGFGTLFERLLGQSPTLKRSQSHFKTFVVLVLRTIEKKCAMQLLLLTVNSRQTQRNYGAHTPRCSGDFSSSDLLLTSAMLYRRNYGKEEQSIDEGVRGRSNGKSMTGFDSVVKLVAEAKRTYT